ncbi:MAG TPA: hypothetical protein PLT99_11615, partial [Chitinophagales bacterium]|nr:hypothetical protein [Chitinophagales bacterium]
RVNRECNYIALQYFNSEAQSTPLSIDDRRWRGAGGEAGFAQRRQVAKPQRNSPLTHSPTEPLTNSHIIFFPIFASRSRFGYRKSVQMKTRFKRVNSIHFYP